MTEPEHYAQELEALASAPAFFIDKADDEADLRWRAAARAGAAASRAHQTPALHVALNDLWIWATEQRTHVDTDPVPDGLEARVVAALQQVDPPPPQTPAWLPNSREGHNILNGGNARVGTAKIPVCLSQVWRQS